MKSLPGIVADNARAARATHRRGCPARSNKDGACGCTKPIHGVDDKVRERYHAAALAMHAADVALEAVTKAAELANLVEDGAAHDEDRAQAYLLLARAATELASCALEAHGTVAARRGRR